MEGSVAFVPSCFPQELVCRQNTGKEEKMKRPRFICGIMFAAMLLADARADVRLPRFFTDNMMLQRERPVRVWGWAAPGEDVKVTLADRNAAAKADEKGRWSVELPAMKEGENLELTVTGRNSITLKNVIVGDIWLCGGQSNMEMPLRDCAGSADDIKAADFSKIRRIKFSTVTSGFPEEDCQISKPWLVCSPQTVAEFTGAGFYFAREIVQKTGVPIGLLDDNWGGTVIEPWVAPVGMEGVSELKRALDGRQRAIAEYAAQLPKTLNEVESWVALTREGLSKGGKLPQVPNIPGNPAAQMRSWGAMYNAMIHPLIRLPIKGVLWYQGESNAMASDYDTYFPKMCALVGGWRKQWGLGDFSFLFVQIAPYKAPGEDPLGGGGWASLRSLQMKALSITNTGMAATSDLGEGMHPGNKYDVGLRLARWALARDYGQKDLVVSGPIFKEMKVEDDKVRLSFDHTGSGLMVGKKEGRAPAVENKESKLKRFAIAGEDKKWHWADAAIDGNTVLLSSPNVKKPVAARYGYAQNPGEANLYNHEGLPAAVFRTDNWGW